MTFGQKNIAPKFKSFLSPFGQTEIVFPAENIFNSIVVSVPFLIGIQKKFQHINRI
jgi:hypothetical protein